MRGKKNKYHPYYVGRRSARIGFLAGVGTFMMLMAAAACIAFAVFMMLDTRTPAQATGNPPEITPVFVASPDLPEPEYIAHAETAAYIQILPPRYDVLYDYEPLYYEYAPTAPPAPTPTPVPTPTPAPAFVISENAPPIPAEYRLLSFYIPDNADLYAGFAYLRPDLDIETVIWMVNVSVHVPRYTQISINTQPNPLLITPAYRLPYGFSPGEMVPVNNDACHLRATPKTVTAFRYMRDVAYAEGFHLIVISAYRPATRQSYLWERGGRRDGAVARPYHSEHQTGRALDLWGPGGLLDQAGPSPTGRWVAENAHYYGFIVRYLGETSHITGYIHEPWHITYVTLEISMYMHENNILSLEEFVGRNPGAALP